MSNIQEAREVIKEIDDFMDYIDYRARIEIQRVYAGQIEYLESLIKEGWITEINDEALSELKSMLSEIKDCTLDLWKTVKYGDTIEWWSSKDDARISAKVLEIGETSVRVDREWCKKPDNMWVNVFWNTGSDVKIIR